jgi:hypothetical protein
MSDALARSFCRLGRQIPDSRGFGFTQFRSAVPGSASRRRDIPERVITATTCDSKTWGGRTRLCTPLLFVGDRLAGKGLLNGGSWTEVLVLGLDVGAWSSGVPVVISKVLAWLRALVLAVMMLVLGVRVTGVLGVVLVEGDRHRHVPEGWGADFSGIDCRS